MNSMDSYQDVPRDGMILPYVGARECIAAGIALPVVSTILLALRFYSHQTTQRLGVGVDDWIASVALFSMWGMGACFIYGATTGALGYPTPPKQDGIEAPVERRLAQMEWCYRLLMIFTYGLTKLSILFFLRRVFVTHKKTLFDRITRIMIGLVISWMSVLIILYIFACGTTFSAYWNSPQPSPQYCPFDFELEEAMASSDLLLDTFIWLLPIPSILRLQLGTKKKFLLSSVFLIGLLAVVASIIRLITYVNIAELHARGDSRGDPMLRISLGLYWSMVEAGAAFIAACLAPIGPLFRRLQHRLSQSRLRYMMSFQSLRSSTSEPVKSGASTETPGFVDPTQPSTTSQAVSTTLSYAERDVEKGPEEVIEESIEEGIDLTEPGVIAVKKEVSVFASIDS